MQWSDDDRRYVQATLEWQEAAPSGSTSAGHGSSRVVTNGDFRVLVTGVESVGKTSLMARFCNNLFPGPNSLPSTPIHTRESPIMIDSKNYTLSILELPASHLPYSITLAPGQPSWKTDPASFESSASTVHLDHALAMTEATMIVYSVRDARSFEAAVRLAAYIRAATSVPSSTNRSSWTSEHRRFMGPQYRPKRRDYGIVLVGNKSEHDLTERVYDENQSSIPETETENRDPDRITAAFDMRGDGPRQVSHAAGSEGAGLNVFLEVSALTGQNVRRAFEFVAREAMRCRGMVPVPAPAMRPQVQPQEAEEDKGVGFLKRMRSSSLLKMKSVGKKLNFPKSPFTKR